MNITLRGGRIEQVDAEDESSRRYDSEDESERGAHRLNHCAYISGARPSLSCAELNSSQLTGSLFLSLGSSRDSEAS